MSNVVWKPGGSIDHEADQTIPKVDDSEGWGSTSTPQEQDSQFGDSSSNGAAGKNNPFDFLIVIVFY